VIRLIWLLAAVAIATASSHFGYLYLVDEPDALQTPELVWLERELSLSPNQVTRVRQLHEQWRPQLAALREKLEAERRNAGATGNNDACAAVADDCRVCTADFIRQMTVLLEPAQQTKYMSLVAECLAPPASSIPSTPATRLLQ
jgi:hypothetical protein